MNRHPPSSHRPAPGWLRGACRLLRYAWAAPWSLAGLILALPALLAGATARVTEGTLEVAGGRLGRAASRLPGALRFSAITFGHVILAIDHESLAPLRAHEQVHVRQYERWGPLFVPLYLGSSLAQLAAGRHPYLQNRFEREAVAKAGAGRPPGVAMTARHRPNRPD